jgi:hypothetical protein
MARLDKVCRLLMCLFSRIILGSPQFQGIFSSGLALKSQKRMGVPLKFSSACYATGCYNNGIGCRCQLESAAAGGNVKVNSN